MASSIVAASGRALGSRHNSYNNLVSSDSGGCISDWMNSSNDNTPKALQIRTSSSSFSHPVASGSGNTNNMFETLSRKDSFTSLSDGFDMISPAPPLSWSTTVDSKYSSIGGGSDSYLSSHGGNSSGLKTTTFIDALHVDDLFDNNDSASSSPNAGTSINLPGWNNDPTDLFGGVLTDSDVDSPEGIWYSQVQHPIKVTRRGLMRNTPSFMLNIDEPDCIGSPGANNHYQPELHPYEISEHFSGVSSPNDDNGSLLFAPLTRSLRSSVSAPLLQRNDSAFETAGTQQSTDECLAEIGFSGDSIPDFPSPDNTSSKDVFASMTHLADSADSPQSSALFQRRSVQRDGNLSAPSPVNTSSPAEQQTLANNDSGGGDKNTTPLDRGTGSNTSVESNKRTEAQRLRLLQLQQLQTSQEMLRMSASKNQTTSLSQQQSLNSGAKDVVAKAAQAARSYGMDANSSRHVGVGPTGLVTPVTPQHPLPPVSSPLQQNATPFTNSFSPLPQRAEFGSEMPDQTYSTISPHFSQSMPHQFPGTNLHNQPPQIFTPQFLHQNDASMMLMPGNNELSMSQGAMRQASGDASGYTSVYPPPRHHSISNGHAERGMYGQTLLTGSTQSDGNITSHRRASHAALLRSTESSPSLATILAANPMQLQNPFPPVQHEQRYGANTQHRSTSTLEPSKLMARGMDGGLAGTGTVDPSNFLGLSVGTQSSAAVPHSAPADASKDTLSRMQQERMHHLQQQQLNFLQHQYNAKNTSRRGTLSGSLSSPLTPPRSPVKMKSTSHLKSPLGSSSVLPSSPGKPPRPTLRKIASNRRVDNGGSSVSPAGAQPLSANSQSSSNSTTSAASSSSLTSATSSAASHHSNAMISSALSPRINAADNMSLMTPASPLRGSSMSKGFTMELLTSASPNRPRTFSEQDAIAYSSSQTPRATKAVLRGSKSSACLSPSNAVSSTEMDAAMASATGGFARLSFVNYGMDDADEICSAVAPSGSYKIPLRGFEGGSGSSGEEDFFDGQARAPRPRSSTASMMDSDNDLDDPNVHPSGFGPPSSPTKKIRRNPSKSSLASGSASPLRSKRSMANIGGGPHRSSADLLRSPRKTKSTMPLLGPAGSGVGNA